MKHLSAVLYLGKCDTGKMPQTKALQEAFLAPYHTDIVVGTERKTQFKKERFSNKDDVKQSWRPFREVAGNSVEELQEFLQKAGFFPNAKIDGIYGYRTRAAVRLFQEYVRTIENDEGIGYPDGIVGPNTFKYIQAWQEKSAEGFVCQWGKQQGSTDTADYQHWIGLLATGKQYFLNNDNEELKLTEAKEEGSDTLAIKDWNTDAEAIHLIGIRRNQTHWFDVSSKNKDLFVLLIKGMTFYFWGSTVSAPKKAGARPAPFLPEGQHQYRFGWHSRTHAGKVYQALKPKDKGVLVFRCKSWEKGYIEKHEMQLDKQPNTTINIHWSGMGHQNYSAGCQVLAGASYINHLGTTINCRPFAASGTKAVGAKEQGITQTYGAYNMLADLILTYGPPGVTTVYYTLVRDTLTHLSDKITNELLEDYLKKLKA